MEAFLSTPCDSNAYMPINYEIVLGDPADLEADALIITTNTDLILGSDHSSSLRRKCPPELQTELDRYAPLALGEVVKTSAHNIKYKAILHLAVMKLGLWPNDRSVNKAFQKAIDICNANKFESFVVPNIEGETTVYSSYKGAKLIQGLINSPRLTTVKKIIICCMSDKSYKVYNEILGMPNPAMPQQALPRTVKSDEPAAEAKAPERPASVPENIDKPSD